MEVQMEVWKQPDSYPGGVKGLWYNESLSTQHTSSI